MTPTKRLLMDVKERLAKSSPGPWWPLHNYGTEIVDPSAIFGECGIVAKGSTAFIGQTYRAASKDIEPLNSNLQLLASAPCDLTKLVAIVECLSAELSEVSKSIVRPISTTDALIQLLQIEKRCDRALERADQIAEGKT